MTIATGFGGGGGGGGAGAAHPAKTAVIARTVKRRGESINLTEVIRRLSPHYAWNHF